MMASQGIPPGRTHKPPVQERAQPPPPSAPTPFGTVAFVTTTPRIIMLTKVFPFLLPRNVGGTLPQALRRLGDDMDRVHAGSEPTAHELASAPLIVDWRCVLTPAGLCLAGFVAGHPLLGTRQAMTSQLWAADAEGRWVRTLRRYYKLGIPADAHRLDDSVVTEGDGGHDE